MRYVLHFLLLTAALASGEEYKPIDSDYLHGTHRLRSSKKNTEMIIEMGTAVAIDLSKYGVAGNRFLLTAAHCVSDDGHKNKVRVELLDDGKSNWVSADIISIDTDRDIALIKASADMPNLLMLSDNDNIQVGAVLLTLGSPLGLGITPTFGYLTGKFMERDHTYQGSMTVFAGNSGGPVIDPNTKTVIGLVSSQPIIPGEGRAMNVVFFVPQPSIKVFMTEHSKEISKASKDNKN